MPTSSEKLNRLRIKLLELLSIEVLNKFSEQELYDLLLLLLDLADTVRLKGAEKSENCFCFLAAKFGEDQPHKVD